MPSPEHGYSNAPEFSFPENTADRQDASKPQVEYLTPETFAERFPLPEGFLDLPTHRVLVENIRSLMCGDVENIDQRDVDYADAFMRVLLAPEEDDGSDERAEALRKEMDLEMTSRLQALTSEFGPVSVLHEQRELMGISDPRSERPFDVVVVRSGPDTSSLLDRRAYWQKISGAPTQVTNRGSKEGDHSTIFIPDYEAKEILEPSAIWSKNHADMLRHEYRHTQRRVAMGNDRAFLMLDEVLTNVTGYVAQTGLLSLLCLTTPDLRRELFKHAYDRDDKGAMAGLLQKFAADFGPKGLLIFGGKRPAQYEEDSLGVPGIPLDTAGIEEEHEEARYAETLLRCRAEQDPDFLDLFQRNIQDPTIPLPRLEVLRHYSLGSLFPRKSTAETMMLKARAILDTEIERRKAAGEVSFYAQS